MNRTQKFDLGQVVATPGALAAFDATAENPYDYVRRHASGDWGDLDQHDTNANNEALREGNRILSVYHLEDSTKIYIITEADRSVTTILLPEDY